MGVGVGVGERGGRGVKIHLALEISKKMLLPRVSQLFLELWVCVSINPLCRVIGPKGSVVDDCCWCQQPRLIICRDKWTIDCQLITSPRARTDRIDY